MSDTGFKTVEESPITVKELKQMLNEFPDDMIVVTNGEKSGYEKILLPQIIEVRHEPENMEFDGEYQIDWGEKNTFEVLAIFRNTRTD